jgi:hypothetical protein
MRITRRRLIGVTFVVSAAAGLLPMSAAVAYISPPLVLLGEAQSPAALVAKGAAVDVPVEYSCTANGMYIGVTLTERVGNGIASGYGSTSVPCDSATHRVLVRVPASASGKAFAKGSATASTSVDGCLLRNGIYHCGSDTVDRTIKLK